MINNEMKTVTVNTYSTSVDSYGQTRTGTPTTRTIAMYYKIYKQNNVENPKYVDVDLVGLTKDTALTVNNEIVIDSKKYVIKYIIPSGRYNQILMSKK